MSHSESGFVPVDINQRQAPETTSHALSIRRSVRRPVDYTVAQCENCHSRVDRQLRRSGHCRIDRPFEKRRVQDCSRLHSTFAVLGGPYRWCGVVFQRNQDQFEIQPVGRTSGTIRCVQSARLASAYGREPRLDNTVSSLRRVGCWSPRSMYIQQRISPLNMYAPISSPVGEDVCICADRFKQRRLVSFLFSHSRD